MGLNGLGLGFTFSAKDSGVGNFFTGLKSSVTSAGKQLGDFAAQASSSMSSLGTSGAALKNVNSELVVFDRAAFNAAKVAGDFTDALSPERIDPGRDSMGRFTKHLYGFSKASTKAEKDFDSTSDAIKSGTDVGTKSLEAMGKMAGKLKDILGQLKVGNLMAAFDLKGLGAVKEALGGLTKGGGNLTTSFEAQAAGVSKSSRMIAANMGLSGKGMKEFQKDFASLVTGQEIGEEAATSALKAWRTNADDMKAIGFTNKASLAKFGNMGVNVDQLSDALRKSRKTYSFADEDLKSLTQSAAAFGMQTGDMKGAMNSLPEVVAQLGDVTDSMGNKLKGAELAKFGRETFAAASAFQQMGYSAEEAQKAAVDLGSTLIKSRKDYAGLFTGVVQQYPEFLNSMNISTGTAQKSFALMNEGPAGFMKGMAQLAADVKASGGDVGATMRMMKSHMVEALGPETGAKMAAFMETADEATLRLLSTTGQVPVDLEKMANDSHQGTRTLADNFQMMEDQFITNFRNIGRKGAQQFVADTGKAFADFTVSMNEVAKGDGPLAGIVQQFSLMHQIGAKALLPESLRPIATIMGTMGSEIVPLLGALGSMGLKFSMLASPIALLAVPIAILVIRFADLMMQGKSLGQAFEQIGKDIFGFLSKIPAFVDKALNSLLGFVEKMFDGSKNLDFVGFFTNLLGGAKGLKGGVKALGPALIDFGKDVMQGIGDALAGKQPQVQSRLAGIIVGLVGTLANTFKALVKGIDASGIGMAFLGVLGSAFQLIKKAPAFLGEILSKLVLGLGATLKTLVRGIDSSGIGAAFVDVLKTALQTVLGAAEGLLKSIDWSGIVGMLLDLLGSAFDALSDKRVGEFLGSIGKSFAKSVNVLGGILLDLVSGALDWLSKADLSKWLVGILNNILSLATSVLSGLGDLVGQILSKIPEWWPKVHQTIVGLLSTLPGMLGETLSGLGDKIGPILTNVFKSAIVAVGQLIGQSPELFMGLVNAIPGILDGLKGLLFGALDLLKSIFFGALDGIMEGLIALFPEYAGPITAVFEGIGKSVEDIFTAVGWVFEAVFAVLKYGFNTIKESLSLLWAGVKLFWEGLKMQFELIKTIAIAVWNAISAAATFVWDAIKAGWNSITTTVTEVVTSIQTTWDNFVLGFTTTVQGIAEQVMGVYSSVQATITGFLDNLNEGWRLAMEYVGSLWTSFTTWFTELWPGLTEVIRGVWQWISDTITGVWTAIKSAGQSVGAAMSGVWQSMMSGIKVVYDFVVKAVNEMKDALASLPGAAAAVHLEAMDIPVPTDGLEAFKEEAAKPVEIKSFVLPSDATKAPPMISNAGFTPPKAPVLSTPAAPALPGMPKPPSLGPSTFTTGASASKMGPVPGVPPAHWEQDSAKAIASYTAVVNAASVMRTGLNTTYTGISTDSAEAFKTANIAIDKLMSEGLVGIFKKTWKTILTGLPKEFFEPYKAEWKKWVEELMRVFGEGLGKMLDAMAVSTKAMTTEVGTIVSDVNQITAAVQTLMAMKAKAAEEKKKQDAAELEASKTTDTIQLDRDVLELRDAINNPGWYIDYRLLFDQRMVALIAAVGTAKAQSSTGPAGAAATQAAKDVRKTLTPGVATKKSE